jgi:hypothetical protein
MELYVYYKVDAHQRAEALAAVHAAQEQVRREWPGITCRLLQRSPGDDAPTWMEIYARDAAPLTRDDCALLEAALAALPPGRTGPRHGEIFSALVEAADARPPC